MKLHHDAIRILVAAFTAAAIGITMAGCSTMGNGGTGASGEVKGNVFEINQRAHAVFNDMNIHMVSSESKNAGTEQTLGGTSGNEDVTINMTTSGPETTRVEVVAKTGTLDWDKDYANKVLSKILQG
jgi:hypothetical protein